MTAKQLAILLAVLLACSVYYNIQCHFEGEPEPFKWSVDSIPAKDIQGLITYNSSC